MGAQFLSFLFFPGLTNAAGEVFEGKHHGSLVCIKIVGICAQQAIKRACSAYSQLHQLCHSRLVSAYGACAKASILSEGK